jgi:hypothetical protein
VTKSLTFEALGGGNPVIDGNGGTAVFHISGNPTVSFQNLTIQNGEVGISIISAATVDLIDIIVQNNSATSSNGSGIANYLGTVDLTNVTVQNNSTAASGGGIYNRSGTMNLTNVTVQNNHSTAASGGGIYNRSGTVNITNTIVAGNSAGGSGGGIYNEYGTVNLTGSTVSDNDSGSSGGGIWSATGYTLHLTGSTISGNHAGGDGGGIYTEGGHWLLDNSTVSSNHSDGRGGGIYAEHLFAPVEVTLSNNSRVSDNSGSSGGGIYNAHGAVLVVDGSTVSGNSAGNGGAGGAGGSGGGIYNASTLTVTNSTVNGNSAGNGGSVSYTGNGGAGGSGGGIYNAGTLQLTSNSTVSGNSAGNGGGVYYTGVGSGGGIYNAGTLTVTDSTVTDNSTGDGGAAQTGDGGDGGPGGGIYNAGTLQLSNNSTVSGNSTGDGGNSGLFGHSGAGGNGGGIYNASGATLTVADSALSDNHTGKDGASGSGSIGGSGGGLFNMGRLELSDSTISNNSAVRFGGGVYGSSTLTLTHSTVISNTALEDGGGLYNEGRMAVTRSTISENTAEYDYGGGIRNASGGVLTLTDSTVSNNDAATQYGGGIHNGGTLTVTSSTVNNNTADTGGGFFNYGTLAILNSTISTNSARWAGGIQNLSPGAVDIQFTTIADNSATQNAASVFNGAGGTVHLLATIITADPTGAPNCAGDTLTPTGDGYNRINDDSCLQSPAAQDVENASVKLGPLANNGGPTLTHKPAPTAVVVDIVPKGECEAAFSALSLPALDQRHKSRPSWGLRQEGQPVPASNWKCDAGAVELGAETLLVCGPPLTPIGNYVQRCTYDTIGGALQQAQAGDTILISGILTETVTVTKSVTIRGPTIEEATPGTHMGVVQGNGLSASVFAITSGVTVTIEDLNIRHGNANQGGAINNAGALTLDRVTLYDNSASEGGGVYNSGALLVRNSTILSNTATTGGGIYNVISGTTVVTLTTLADNIGGTLYNESSVADSLRVGGSILSSSEPGNQCANTNVTSDNYNLVQGNPCFTASKAYDITGDPLLGPLRDNGGPTLTRALAANSPAVEAGPPADSCAVTTDQRGKTRPFDMLGGGGARCDIGAVEYAPTTLTVCEKCNADPANGRFNDLQQALNQATNEDTIAIEAGIYTGNFIAYKDVTLQHAGIDVNAIGRDQALDVRAILQASSQTIPEQHRALTETQTAGLSGTVLTVKAFRPSDATITSSNDLTVTMRGLTILHGLSRQGGGIYNLGHLYIFTSTIAENAAVNELATGGVTPTVKAQGGGIYNAGQLTLERSTVSGNQSEYYGGGIYNDGAGPDDQATVLLEESTIAANKASRLPAQHVIPIDTGPVFVTSTLTTVFAGDLIQFQNRTGNAYQLSVSPAGLCNASTVKVGSLGTGLSDPLTCAPGTVTLRSNEVGTLVIAITVNPLPFTPQAHAIYANDSKVTVARSIIANRDSSAITNCALSSSKARIASGQYNLADDSSCNLTDSTDLVNSSSDIKLGPLQDNNFIDFEHHTIGGYTYSHALLPGSVAIDRIPPEVCSAATEHDPIVIASGNQTRTIEVGDIVRWKNGSSTTVSTTVALNDGEANVNLITVPVNQDSRAVQFNEPGMYHYRAYDNETRDQIANGFGTIIVNSRTRRTDQRGVLLPQRGTGGAFYCDIGAYEFQPWVVGQPILRPPSAVVAQQARWVVGGGGSQSDVQSYHAWSPAQSLDYPLRPSWNKEGNTPDAKELVTVYWDTDPDPASLVEIAQVGVIEWPDNPQIHVSGAGVSLIHDKINDGFQVSAARAFEGLNPADDEAGQLLVDGVFHRTVLTATAGDSYSVLQWAKGNQNNATLKVQVVKTVDWNTPGVRDMRSARTQCEIGRELRYWPFTDDAGTLPGHEDPEGKSGQILTGNAFDGVHKTIDLSTAQNTVDNLIPPAYNQETREGPIIPILNTAPTSFTNTDPVTGDHDLRVAWYRPDGRNVAWPVKTVGYRCHWPTDPPQIVIASELGSEIDGQAVLSTDAYNDVTIYHQPDPNLPGYSPNWEHALLSDSNLGNAAPALYALRTDLMDRDPTQQGGQSYAMLKYHDPHEDGRTKIAIYKVVLTRAPVQIQNVSALTGTVTLNATTAMAMSTAMTAQSQAAAATSPNVVLRVGDGSLSPGGEVSLPLEALGARNFYSVSLKVHYDPNKLTPTACTPNRLDFIEQLYGLQVESDAPQQPGHVVHLHAGLAAGTDAQYKWDFGDGVVRVAGSDVSHVYGTPYTYTVVVTATNGVFADLVVTTPVTVSDSLTPGSLGTLSSNGCHIEQPGELTVAMKARSKHGLSGDLNLMDITFTTGSGFTTPSDTAAVSLDQITLFGPDYQDLSFNITAGNPVYAPAPLRSLLDIQPCAQTRASDDTARPFWKDYKGMLWARAAGDMKVLYFYPLQAGFYFSDTQALELGLVDKDGNVLPADEQVGKCVPWMHKLLTDTVPYEGFPQPVDSTQPLPGFNQVMTTTRVLPVSYHVDWPDLPPLLSVGETVYERAKSGISGVANQLAVSRIYDDLSPGHWDNTAQKIVVQGPEVQRSLAQLIDPVGEVRVHLSLTNINGDWTLPSEIKTERLLFGGGQAIVGNKSKPDKALPFSLRTRILYDDLKGDLIFRGYYDGTSKEYIKGDPLLLLNVMSTSDKTRLQALCSGGKECTKYQDAVEELYWRTWNPRQLDLCRNSAGELYAGDPEPDDHQKAWDANNTDMHSCATSGYYRDGQPDHAFLIGVQDVNNDGIPEPYEGLGKGKALTAGNAAGVGYITVAYNNDPSLGGLPVSLQVIKVGCTKNHLGEDSTYRGNLLVIKSDNLFDEKLTLRHTGDFGGRPDKFHFKWYIAPVDATGVSPTTIPSPSSGEIPYPWKAWTQPEPGAQDIGPEITIEGANPTTLRDNWLIMTYQGYPVCGNQYRWSAFAGDPSAKPSEVRAQFAPGWIKRVTSALNPFDARVKDFISAPVNTTVDMIRQAGPRYEGPVALSNDPDTINNMGLIEAYETVLDRGRHLSIDAGVNDQGANAALLNVTSRIADLYMLLSNDAYMDALDPTVGLGTDSALASRAPTIFAFMNQFRPDSFGLIDEELALLRGRDETLGGVAAPPTYNRLTWNFTNGDGEVAYVTNYNIKDVNQDGFVDEADAAIMYPQGHGDAWGHALTAIGKYYQLLRHPNYTWSPRAEPISVAGAPVVVDYYDERRFAIAAANKARIGAEIVDLTYRKEYSDPNNQEYIDTHVDADGQKRSWGVADWARRAGQGAYLDWVVANAILPPEDNRYTDVRKIDRTTVDALGEIADEYDAIQRELDEVDSGLNPLGLAGGAVLFDLDPAQTKTTPEHDGKTHFEQVYDRAIASLGNILTLFDYANEMKLAERESQDKRRDFVTRIIEEDNQLMNELIEIFGYPYDADIGVNGTYPEGYDGPDIYNYDLWDHNELTDAQKRCSRDDEAAGLCENEKETKTYTIEYSAIECLGKFPQRTMRELAKGDLCPDVNLKKDGSNKVKIEYRIGVGLDAGRGRFKPASWPEDSARKAPGEIQNALQDLTEARLEYEMAITAYQNQVERIDSMQQKIKEKAEYLRSMRQLQDSERWTIFSLDQTIRVLKGIAKTINEFKKTTITLQQASEKCPPRIVGLSYDIGSPVVCALSLPGAVLSTGLSKLVFGLDIGVEAVGAVEDATKAGIDTAILAKSSNYELAQYGKEMGELLRQERELRLEVYLAKDKVNSAQGNYDQILQRGFRKLKELSRLRKRWAGQITEQRYNDMAYRIFQNDALQKYRKQFDMAQTYTYLAAAAYDYETNLSGDDPANGDKFLRQIVGLRSLGGLQYNPGAPVQPIAGSGGLADPLARMRDNFAVLKGQMGFNNPQAEGNRFSLRHELFRLRDSSDTKWRQKLMRYYTPNIYNSDAVARLAKRPYGGNTPQPGLVIPMSTSIIEGQNFFGHPLGPGDSAYDATQFSTKIAKVGVWFRGYDTSRLSQTPRVYLLPAGKDAGRPRHAGNLIRYWNVVEQLLPVPYPITQADMEDPLWSPRLNGLDGQMYAIKPYARFRAYPYSETITPDELNTDTRLIGRSVWNTEWLLVIPGDTLLSNPQQGIERFIEDVDDIYVYFQTYAYAGN